MILTSSVAVQRCVWMKFDKDDDDDIDDDDDDYNDDDDVHDSK